MLTAAEVAERLQVSPAWVYAHKHALGAFQLFPRSPVRFSEKHIEELLNALPNGEREVARQADDRGRVENKNIPDQNRGKAVGGGTKRGGVGRTFADPFHLLD